MDRIGRIFFSAAFSAVLLFPAARSQGRSPGEHWARRKVRIERELKKLGGRHPWAGTYFQGDGLGFNFTLSLAPSAGFTFLWRGCLGVYERLSGSVIEKKGGFHRLVLVPDCKPGENSMCPAKLFVLAWGRRRYLVPEAELPLFCTKVNDGSEPRGSPQGFFFLRWGDEKKEVRGFPFLPLGFNKFLHHGPIVVGIVDFLETRVLRRRPGDTHPLYEYWFSFRISRPDSITGGMRLHPWRPRRGWRDLEVVKVAGTAGLGRIRSSRPLKKKRIPARGWRFSTWFRFKMDKLETDRGRARKRESREKKPPGKEGSPPHVPFRIPGQGIRRG